MKLRPCFWAGCGVAVGLLVALTVLIALAATYVVPNVWSGDSLGSWVDSLFAESTAEEEIDAYDPVSLGKSLACSGREVTVQSVRRETAIDGRTPGAGNVFIVVTLKIRNLGSSFSGYDTSEFMVAGNKDSVTDLAHEPDTGNLLGSGTLRAVSSVKGEIVRRVDAEDTALVLVWHDSSRICGYLSLE